MAGKLGGKSNPIDPETVNNPNEKDLLYPSFKFLISSINIFNIEVFKISTRFY